MTTIRFGLLRGVCQSPAYTAFHRGLFAAEGLDVELHIAPTAWMVPEQLLSGDRHFAVIPWTRIAAAERGEAPMKLLCGSGLEEAVMVIRAGLDPLNVRSIGIPREGGMKDLTAMALVDSLGWSHVERLRFPSGDGAIIAFFGQGVDAASMVEPYATMMEAMGLGTAIRRTGDIWPGAPGCSLAASAAFIEREPDVVQRVVRAYVRAIAHVRQDPDDAAACAAPYIGVKAEFIAQGLRVNPPSSDGIRNMATMDRILAFMQTLGYINHIPRDFADLRFLDGVETGAASVQTLV